jgi:hypothetical protein
MAKHLSDNEIEKVVKLLIGWKGRLTWDRLASACQSVIGRTPSRQTLARAARVELAFKTTKERLRKNESSTRSVSDPSTDVLLQRIARLEAEMAQLKAENGQLLEQFVRWQYNAFVGRISPERLNKALPPVDLRPTRGAARMR